MCVYMCVYICVCICMIFNWFKNLSDKHKHKFIKFGIAEFYPPFSENFLNKSIKYDKYFTKVVICVINLAR